MNSNLMTMLASSWRPFQLVLAALVALTASEALAQKCYEPGRTRACTTFDGCTGSQFCDSTEGEGWGYWSECNYTSTSTRACGECGTGGRQACGGAGYGPCQPPTATAEAPSCDQCDSNRNGQLNDGVQLACTTPDGCTGVRTCESTTCGYTATSSRACAQCGPGGTQTCSASGYGACQPQAASAEVCDSCDNNKNGQVDEALVQACAFGNGCGGTQACTNGSWAACGCGGAQSTVTCGQSSCGTAKQMTCDASCQPVTVCIAEEVCNGCDDDGSGVADDYVVCGGKCAAP